MMLPAFAALLLAAEEAPTSAARPVLASVTQAETVTEATTPTTLRRGPLRETATVQQEIVATITVKTLGPAQYSGPRCVLGVRPYVQMRICIISLTGFRACSEPSVYDLPDETEADFDLPSGATCAPSTPEIRSRIDDVEQRLAGRGARILEAERQSHLPTLVRRGTASANPSD